MRLRRMLRRSDRGQSIVELALALPLIILIALGLVEFGLMMHGYIMVTQAAREGARAAAFGDDDPTVTTTTLAAAGGLPTGSLTVTIVPAGTRTRGSSVAVTVAYAHSTFTPGLKQVLPVVDVTGRVTMRVE